MDDLSFPSCRNHEEAEVSCPFQSISLTTQEALALLVVSSSPGDFSDPLYRDYANVFLERHMGEDDEGNIKCPFCHDLLYQGARVRGANWVVDSLEEVKQRFFHLPLSGVEAKTASVQ